jgi:hypothetical protein
MDHRFSLSVFTIEVNGTPTVTVTGQEARNGSANNINYVLN